MKKLLLILFLLIITVNVFGERVLIPESEVDRVGFEKINENADKFIRKSKLGYYIFEIDLNKLKDIGVKHYKVEEKKVTISNLPNDPYLKNQWSVSKTNLDKLWDNNTDCSDVVIAVADTGVDFTHEDLQNNINTNIKETCNNSLDDDNNGYIDDCIGWDFFYDDNDPIDGHGHGTHVAGIIGAVGNNDKGVSGVCWNAKIMPVKVLDDSGGGNESDVADGIIYAVDNGAKVINLSLEANFSLPKIYSAIDYAEEQGVIVVVAAGNEGYNIDDQYIYPAAYSKDFDNLISVGNSNQDDKVGTRSNYGSILVDIFAPGEDIYSTWINNRYEYETGTSMATPFITGLIAHFLSVNLGIKDPFLVKAQVIKSAEETFQLYGKTISGGRVDASKILDINYKPSIIKIFPESYPSNKFKGVLNEKVEIYGYLNNVKDVYIDDSLVDFEQVDNKTLYIITPFTDKDFKIYVEDVFGGVSNKVKITPIPYKVKTNNAYYTFSSLTKILGLTNSGLNGYITYGSGIKFYNYSSTLTVNKSKIFDGDCYLKDENGDILLMKKMDEDTCTVSNLSTNKEYTFYEAEQNYSGGGGGCSLTITNKSSHYDALFFALFLFVFLKISKITSKNRIRSQV